MVTYVAQLDFECLDYVINMFDSMLGNPDFLLDCEHIVVIFSNVKDIIVHDPSISTYYLDVHLNLVIGKFMWPIAIFKFDSLIFHGICRLVLISFGSISSGDSFNLSLPLNLDIYKLKLIISELSMSSIVLIMSSLGVCKCYLIYVSQLSFYIVYCEFLINVL